MINLLFLLAYIYSEMDIAALIFFLHYLFPGKRIFLVEEYLSSNYRLQICVLTFFAPEKYMKLCIVYTYNFSQTESKLLTLNDVPCNHLIGSYIQACV
jgi:hypothetical protein